MKNFAITALAALAATVSLASVAEAHHRHFDDDWRWGYHHRHHYWDDVDYGRDYCRTIKVVKFDDWGNKVVKIINKCDY